MKFAQIIDFETERIDEVRDLMRAYEEQVRSAGRTSTPAARTLLRDRANPNRYLAVVQFESHEDAMANSNAPETSELAQRLSGLMTRPPVYTDCDIAEHRTTG
ncbi:putative quinol monooxygenase [Streptomyces sp. NPDC054883]